MIPTVSGHWLLGSVPDMQRDFLGLLMRATREHGDVVRIRIGPNDAVLVNHPDLVERVMVGHLANYGRDRAFGRAASTVLGRSLILSEGEGWKQRRRTCTPMFHRQMVQRFADTMVSETRTLVARWRSHPGKIGVAAEMSALALGIVGKTLFGADFEGNAHEIAVAEDQGARDIFGRLQMPFQIPDFVPTPANVRLRRIRRTFEHLVRDVLVAARRSPDEPTLAAMLLAARDAETGAAMDDTQILDELIGFLLAGHETTANTLTWTFGALAREPELADVLRAEHAAVLGDRTPTAEDVGRLPETSKVLNEAMRLWPSAWFLPRRTVADDDLGAHRIRAGQVVWVSPYVLHRHPGFWTDPERFLPTRFTPDADKARHRQAFIPFGTGQRMCIGASYAAMEMHLVLATVLREFRFALTDDCDFVPSPYVTLRPRSPMTLEVTAAAARP